MFDNDYPLLHAPQLMALILHRAEHGPATLADCLSRLRALLDQAGEKPPLSAQEIERRVAGHVGDLTAARLIEPAGGGFAITDRGREALRRHPLGFDRADLMEYPEFAATVRARAHHAAGMDSRAASFDEGYSARRAGQGFTENPYTLNTVDHIAWENGWMLALDEEPPQIPARD